MAAADLNVRSNQDNSIARILRGLGVHGGLALGFVSKGQLDILSQALLSERHFQHAAKVLDGAFKPGEHSPAFFEPTDETFNNVLSAVFFAVEFHRSSVAIFIFCRWNDQADAQFQKIFIDPVSTIYFVTTKYEWSCNTFSFTIQ